MKKLRQTVLEHPFILSACVFFLASFLCVISVEPTVKLLEKYMDTRKATFLYYTVYQALWAIIMLPVIKGAGILETAGFTKPKEWKQVWLCWPLVTMVVISGWDIFSGNMKFNTSEPAVFIIYILLNVSVGFYEEIIGRSFILNLMLQKWGKTKKGIYRAVFTSSLLFGVLHLTTVILGKRELIPGIAQVFYAIFFGVFFAACFIRNNSVWPMIFVHAFVDMIGCAGGLTDRFGQTEQANISNTFIVVLLDLPLLLYGIFLLRKVNPSDISSRNSLNY